MVEIIALYVERNVDWLNTDRFLQSSFGLVELGVSSIDQEENFFKVSVSARALCIFVWILTAQNSSCVGEIAACSCLPATITAIADRVTVNDLLLREFVEFAGLDSVGRFSRVYSGKCVAGAAS